MNVPKTATFASCVAKNECPCLPAPPPLPTPVSTVYPDLSTRPMSVPLSFINANIGIDLSASQIAALLRRMQLQVDVAEQEATTTPPAAAEAAAAASSSGGKSDTVLSLQVPATRSDILHAVDVMEDAAIAYGFNNIPKRVGAPLCRDMSHTSRGNMAVSIHLLMKACAPS